MTRLMKVDSTAFGFEHSSMEKPSA